MKKELFFVLLAAFSLRLHATTVIVQVSNFKFESANFTITLGDTIQWQWVGGSHTTTSVNIPAGAAAWDSPMNSVSTTFTYVPTVAGTYSYRCTPHQASMLGGFTVNPFTNTLPGLSAHQPLITQTLVRQGTNLKLAAPASLPLLLEVFDLQGRRVAQQRIDAGSTELNSLAWPSGSLLVRISRTDGTLLERKRLIVL